MKVFGGMVVIKLIPRERYSRRVKVEKVSGWIEVIRLFSTQRPVRLVGKTTDAREVILFPDNIRDSRRVRAAKALGGIVVIRLSLSSSDTRVVRVEKALVGNEENWLYPIRILTLPEMKAKAPDGRAENLLYMKSNHSPSLKEFGTPAGIAERLLLLQLTIHGLKGPPTVL